MNLGQYRIAEAARNLLALRGKVADDVARRCGALVIVGADTPTYTRPDGVVVTSIAALEV